MKGVVGLVERSIAVSLFVCVYGPKDACYVGVPNYVEQKTVSLLG